MNALQGSATDLDFSIAFFLHKKYAHWKWLQTYIEIPGIPNLRMPAGSQPPHRWMFPGHLPPIDLSLYDKWHLDSGQLSSQTYVTYSS